MSPTVSPNARLCRYPSESRSLEFLGSVPRTAYKLICTSLFHAAYDCAFTPFESENQCALGHCHALLSASSVHHGFTEYTFCAPTTVKAAYGHVFTPFDSGFWRSLGRCHPLLSVSCLHHGYTKYTVCALPSVEPKAQHSRG